VKVESQLSTKTRVMGAREALELASRADQIIVARGARVVRIDLKNDRPARKELLGLLLGPTGNLRAPTLLRGRTLLVGFNEESYRAALR
jgi:arsenate reductase-like glutaredoxin family protein